MHPTTDLVDIPELLHSAGPSIGYRTRHEVLSRSADDPELRELQSAILAEPSVERFPYLQRSDGWIGDTFHGADGIEGAIRFLAEKGVRPDHSAIRRALDALEAGDERLLWGIGKVGRVLDETGLGGSEMIRAAVFGYAGDEDRPCVREQVEIALQGFEAVVDVESIEAICEPYKGNLVFREGVLWPSIYHLRLLAHTTCWRTSETMTMLAAAVRRLVELSPIPEVHVKHRSQLIAPASFAMDDFASHVDERSGYGQMLWFHRTELLARLGMIPHVPALQSQVGRLAESLEAGLFRQKMNHSSFKKWGVYAGLALERDWRSPARRIADLTFRVLLILHHTETPSGL